MFAGHVAVWFEIPVADLARATTFYQSVFAIEMPICGPEEMRMALFPHDENTISGCLSACGGVKPSADGSTVYLNCGDDLAVQLARVESAGGKMLLPKTAIPDYPGFFAHFLDSEGNRVGLYSLN
ncbi:MAG: VOC family protein [Sulfuricella sp.]|nr:VOC family protein [Sulfuricella sp.]